MEHEVAKLVGAPPGYLGHRETQPMLTQPKLAAVASENCNLSLVLFDEIEKAAREHDPIAARRAGQSSAAAGRQHDGEFRANADLPDQQSGSSGDAQADLTDFGFEGMVAEDGASAEKI